MVIFSLSASIKTLVKNKRFKQASILYLSMIISLILGITVSVINTRLLGAQAFGDFKFLQTIWTLGVTFITFGFFATGGNLLTKKESVESERALSGSLLIIACVIAALFILAMSAASIPIGYIYGQELANKLRLFSSLAFVFPLQVYLQEVLRGTNGITNLAILTALPQILYIPAALITNNQLGYTLDTALLLYLLSMLVTVLLITLLTKPHFKQRYQGIKEIINHNRAIGLNVYWAVLITTTTTQLSQFSLAYFFDTRLVGIFSLAVTITMPLTMIPNAIATTFFKQFANLHKIPSKVIIATFGISILTLLIFLGAIKEIILFLYSQQFIEVVPIAYVCAIGAILHGIGDVYNRFLLAHGRTKTLRNNSIALGILSILGYVYIVAEWSVQGAAYTKLLIDVIYLISMIIYYLYYKNNIIKSHSVSK